MLHNDIGILKFEDIHKTYLLKFVHKCLNDTFPCIFHGYFRYRSNMHSCNTRNKAILHVPIYNNMVGKHFITCYAAKLWNSLPEGIHKEGNIDVFETLVYNNLMESYQ